MNRSNVIVGSPTCDPEGVEATVAVTKLEESSKIYFFRVCCPNVPNLATSSDIRCGASFIPN
jgi:hypothetical protein